jgi:hypothetical protein
MMNKMASKLKIPPNTVRCLLILLILCFAACEGEDCSMEDNPGCRDATDAQVAKDLVLTSENPSIKLVSDTAVINCGMSAIVEYRWEDYKPLDLKTGEIGTGLNAKDMPPMTLSLNSSTGARFGNDQFSEPRDNAEWWRREIHGSIGLNEKDPETLQTGKYTFTVSLQKPLISLPGKGPVIKLPIIGTILGPKVRNVHIRAALNYSKYTPKGNTSK